MRLPVFATLIAVLSAGARVSAYLGPWHDAQYAYAVNMTAAAVSPPGGSAGSVQASPSRSQPDYFYHWVRDGALTVQLLVDLVQDSTTSATDRARFLQLINDNAVFSRKIQSTSVPMDNAKFMMDSSPFTGPWCNPQRDGPALRATMLVHHAYYLRSQGKDISWLYDGKLPTNSVIKTDLEYVSHNWQQDGCDIWEEIRGTHFYTRLVQYRALMDGMHLASDLGDSGASSWYGQQAAEIARTLTSFFDNNAKAIVPTINRTGGLDYKTSNIDVQVLLAAIHSAPLSSTLQLYGPDHDMIHATTVRVINAFKPLYAVNANYPALGTAIGRYPEDRYTGYDSNGLGNPWALATSAIAEICYRTKYAWKQQLKFAVTALNKPFIDYVAASGGTSSVSFTVGETVLSTDSRFNVVLNALMSTGEKYMERVKLHTGTPRHMNEQWLRDTGYQTGAPDLTWSYAAYATAYRAHRQAANQ
ncbi:Six-hairpin glycosidase [Ramicandelaber brevisporus]|nr:Six-hairpin glycosidase [Ramicandelaber brevisporus]